MDDDSQCTCLFNLQDINSMPLGLEMVRIESFQNLVELGLSKAADNVDIVGSHHDKVKMRASKPSNLPITTLTVGNWKRESNRQGDLTAKFYYAKKKLVWEFLDGPLKSKMEVSWSDITAIEAVTNPNQPGFLRVELANPPLFFREIPPQPKKRSSWEAADDFTGGQAQVCRRHEATFPPGALDKHYEKLLLNDTCLAELSRRHESVLPLQQLHHSLNSNIIGASAPSNSVMAAWGNEINNEPTFVGSSHCRDRRSSKRKAEKQHRRTRK